MLQHRVRDLTTTIAAARSLPSTASPRRVVLCGEGRAGLWALLAAPAADAVAADCAQLNPDDDHGLLASDLFCPGFRAFGGFESAALLGAPHPLLLHNTGDAFTPSATRATYHALGATRKLRVESAPVSESALTRWLGTL
jgi:hypothetical protein